MRKVAQRVAHRLTYTARPGPGLWLVGHITREPGRFAAYSAWPLPRVLLVHLGDMLGIEPAASVEKNVEGHLDLKPVIGYLIQARDMLLTVWKGQVRCSTARGRCRECCWFTRAARWAWTQQRLSRTTSKVTTTSSPALGGRSRPACAQVRLQ